VPSALIRDLRNDEDQPDHKPCLQQSGVDLQRWSLAQAGSTATGTKVPQGTLWTSGMIHDRGVWQCRDGGEESASWSYRLYEWMPCLAVAFQHGILEVEGAMAEFGG